VASFAIEMALEVAGMLPPTLQGAINTVIEHEYELLLNAYIVGPEKRTILTPSEFFALNSEFESGKTTVEVASGVNAKLLEYFRLDPQGLHALTPRQFEELIAEIFDGFGFSVELTKTTRDGGRDVIAIRENIAKEKFLIECKRYNKKKPIDVGLVRALLGVVHDERATKGILATTSYFTGPSREFIDRNIWQLEGRDFDGLLNWLEEYQRKKVEQLLRRD
jgi:hypothetical protein